MSIETGKFEFTRYCVIIIVVSKGKFTVKGRAALFHDYRKAAFHS